MWQKNPIFLFWLDRILFAIFVLLFGLMPTVNFLSIANTNRELKKEINKISTRTETLVRHYHPSTTLPD